MENPSETNTPLGGLETRHYQQEMLEESLKGNIIIALDTGSGKTHIAVLRMKVEAEREQTKVSWFLAPTVALCEQQRNVIRTALPVSVGLVSGALEPNQWKDPNLWRTVLNTHRIMVSTPQVLLDALRHAYIDIGRDISLLVFDEAHHAVDNDPYNQIMKEFYYARARTSEVERPKILGLTASPIFGGDVTKAFMTIETNLDSVIRSPRRHREELSKFVHRPTFKHALYPPPDYLNPPFSRNLAALQSVLATMDIEDDPYVQSLRDQLEKLPPGPERDRMDQKLSKTIQKENSFTHKGLRDFARAASEICIDIGPWAADWYVEKVLEKAKSVATPYQNIITTWQSKEKAYLTDYLNKVTITPVSYNPNHIVLGTSLKVQVLVRCLMDEKANTESFDESYNGLIFVTRRDSVVTLSEVLSHHPFTKDLFNVGYLLGTSESAFRHSFLDITRMLQRQSQEDILSDFRIGEKNLIVSTSVAEEGIDIQACGSVIRWDPPANMASWAQSRGRARRKRSTFTLMFEDGGAHEKDVEQWERLEQEMVDLYNNSQRELQKKLAYEDELIAEEEEEELEFRIETTGALLTLNSAVSHLNHFCSVIPNTSHLPHNPIYDIDPPDFPYGWHSFRVPQEPYMGPFGSTVTLPRLLPPHLRVFSTIRVHPTKISAHRHVAFKAYLALYDAGLLNDNLLPLSSVVESHLEDDVVALLKDVEKRSGTAGVSGQMDPWASTGEDDVWWPSELVIDGLPPLRMFSRSQPKPLTRDDGPTLYRTGCAPAKVSWRPLEGLDVSNQELEKARHYTRRLFWGIHGARMNWDDLDFAYLFLPTEVEEAHWGVRRSWLDRINAETGRPRSDAFSANAGAFGAEFSFPSDLVLVRNGPQFAKPFRFVRWQYDPISSEDEVNLRRTYSRWPDLEITYPLLVVQPYPSRINFLQPTPPRTQPISKHVSSILHPKLSSVVPFSIVDTEYASLLPSTLRSLSVTLTVNSLRNTLFAGSPLSMVPLDLLTTATTAPVSNAQDNYQRLETLGDTVLKFVVGVQLLSEYPHWHEGYLSKKKDHAVSNVRLAKDALAKELYRWIIRDTFVPRRWKPAYFSTSPVVDDPATTDDVAMIDDVAMADDVAMMDDVAMTDDVAMIDDLNTTEESAKSKKSQQLSTKVLADVVESLIGAAYLHGSFDLAIECAQTFGLGLTWQKLQQRLDVLITRVEHHDDVPSQITDVERILGYNFTHKLLLVEALTHASHQYDLRTVSYERLEFLGDSVLDMVVTDYLYHAPGKRYSPGHMHLRKSALVNMHFLAYICLRSTLTVDAAMPKRDGSQITLAPEQQQVHLWQCLLHSNHRILDDQNNTFARFKRGRDQIEDGLNNGSIFPWGELTRLQSPKFFSDMVESLIGAVYLDSHGDFGVVRQVMTALGIIPIMERIVKDDVDVLHPVSRLSLWASRVHKEVNYTFKTEKGEVVCIISVDGEEVVQAAELYRGHASQEEVKFLAAEKAISILHLHAAASQKIKAKEVNEVV